MGAPAPLGLPGRTKSKAELEVMPCPNVVSLDAYGRGMGGNRGGEGGGMSMNW